MTLRLALFLLASTAATPAFALDMTVTSKVDAVTVFPSGAEVTRVAESTIMAGEHTLVFEGLPGDLMPETIRVEGNSSGKIEIGSFDSRLAYVSSKDADARRKVFEFEMQKLQDERAVLDQTVSDAEYQKSLMQQLASGAFVKSSKDGEEDKRFGADDLGPLLDLVGGKLQALSKLVLDSRVRQRQIDETLADLSRQMAELAPEDQARMTVTVHLTAPAESKGTFKLKYRIANAGWQPLYDARLNSPDKTTAAKIELVRRAEVTQSTTEDWSGVKLTLSTARPVGATSAPDIMPQQLDGFEAGRAQNYSRSADQAAAPKTVLESLPSLDEQEIKKDKTESLRQLQAEVQVAGFQALYAIPGRVSVDNTGTAKNVRIDTTEIEAKLSARAVPKIDPNAYLTAAFTLPGETPVLAGVTMLYRDGVFMGQGYLPMLSPGEETRLGFGADDLIKVKRVEVKRKIGEEGIISTSNVDERAYDITVKNLHDFAIPVTILDQMPFSTSEDIDVEALPGMTPPSIKDFEKKRGVFAWSFDLEARAEKVLKHGFKITWPRDMQVGMNFN